MARQNCSRQASPEHFQQCAKFLPLCNRGVGPLAVTILPIPLARRAAATACAAVQSTAPLFRRWRPAGLGKLTAASGLSPNAAVAMFGSSPSSPPTRR